MAHREVALPLCVARVLLGQALGDGKACPVEFQRARDIAKQPRRERRGGVLHPPGAVVIAREPCHGAAERPAQRAGRQPQSVEPRRPAGGVVLDRDIERRLGEMCLRNRARHRAAVAVGPALPQPIRRVEARRVLGGDERRSLAGEAPQQRVDQTLERPAGVRSGERDRAVDRGVRRRVEEQELAGAEPEDQPHDARLGRQRLGQAVVDRRVDLAQTAQRGGDQQPREGAVARIQPRQPGMVGDRVVERPALRQHGIEQIERRGTGGCGGRHYRAV